MRRFQAQELFCKPTFYPCVVGTRVQDENLLT